MLSSGLERRARLMACGLAAFAVMVLPAPACRAGPASTRPAQSADELSPMRSWLTELASPDACVREVARVHLMKLKREQLPELRNLVEQCRPLAPSQAIVLRQIVQEVFLSGEPYEAEPHHGFLGILMGEADLSMRDQPQEDDERSAPGVVVIDRIPGFCAARTLIDGDVILGTSEQVFAGPSVLKLAIQQKSPGDIVQLRVLRHGRLIDVPLTLDAHPAQVTSESAVFAFKAKRLARFNEYWEKTFAPLLKEQVG